MKVLMLNGSPRKEGCTYTALIQIAGVLEKNGIESEIFQAGTPELENVRAAAEKMKEADALIVGSPVYWASPSGQIIEFMDKFCSLAGKDMLLKPAAAIASARRAGTTATLDVLLKYFSFHQMPIVSSNYWNMVHGNTPDEVLQDKEGIQILIGLSACCLLPDIFIPFFSILSCLICVYYSEFKKNTIFLKHF